MSNSLNFFAAPDKRALVLPGVPADHTYTFTVRAYRRVDTDIDPTGYILSPAISAAAYKPINVAAFKGDITGTIQGRSSLDVVINLENIASDSVLSTTEKPGVILNYNQGVYNWGALDAKATDVGGFPAQQDAALAAKNALTAYLQSLTPAWDDTSLHTPIDKVVFQNKWASFYSALADLQAAITGRAGADAKTLVVISDRQTINYDGTGAPSPTTQTTKFTAQKQNTTATVSWSVKDINGVVRTASSYLSSTTGDTVTMTEAQFAGARNGTKGVIVTGSITVDGLTITDSISVVAVGDGANGAPGTPGAPGAPGADGLSVREVTVFKRSSTQPAVPTGGSYNFSTGTLTAPSGWNTVMPTGPNPVWAARGSVAIIGQSGTATPTWFGVGLLAQDGSAVNIVFQRSATQPVTPGASAATPAGWYDSVDNVPAGSNPLWACFGARPDSQSSYTWQTPVRQQGVDGSPGEPGAPGAPGPAGPTISLTADDLSFDFIDGITMNANQVITLTATKQNTTEAINWTVSPAVTLGSPNANQRTLSITDFGQNTFVTITATGATSGAKASVTLIRSNLTTPTDSIIPDSGFRSGVGGSGTGTGWTGTGKIRTQIP